MILLIDNYDSFTFNLYHVLGEAALRTGPYHCDVWRNDKLSVERALGMQPEAIILSPGPCTPNEARHLSRPYRRGGRQGARC